MLKHYQPFNYGRAGTKPFFTCKPQKLRGFKLQLHEICTLPRNPLVRLALRAQPVDVTPSNQLFRQYFPLQNRSVRLYSIRTIQGSISFESTLANEILPCMVLIEYSRTD